MSLQPAPVAATWLLEQFCSGAEHDSVIGDLLEQYHLGRGRFWYWRQALVIVFLGLYGRAARRPLLQKTRPSGRPLFVLPALLVAAFIGFIWAPEAVGVVLSFSLLFGTLGMGMVAFSRKWCPCLIQPLVLREVWVRPRVPGPRKKLCYLKLSD